MTSFLFTVYSAMQWTTALEPSESSEPRAYGKTDLELLFQAGK